MVQRLNKGERVADGRQVDVAARLVRLGLEREVQVGALRPGIVAQEVQRLSEAFDAFSGVLRRVRLDALAATPEQVGKSAPHNRLALSSQVAKQSQEFL